MNDLHIVMPVYNEEDAIGAVVSDWLSVLNTIGMSFEIHVYNDGSKDNTKQVLDTVAQQDTRLVPHHKTNSGHGPTILQGYKEQMARATWVFQVDSDNELAAKDFPPLWACRDANDFILGVRDEREQVLSRKLVSAVSRLVVRVLFGKGISDVNSPYRLMRSSVFAPLVASIPDTTMTPNLIVSGYVPYHALRAKEIAVPHKNRETGSGTKPFKILKMAVRAFVQVAQFRFYYTR